MNNKSQIESLAKKIGAKKEFGCKSEESCSDCPMSDNCPCREYAKIVIDLGYEDANAVQKSTARSLLAILKSHAYYPIDPAGSREIRVVDEDDIDKEFEQFLKK